MFERIFTMKMLPPGRGLFAMGTPVVHEKNIAAALYNCAFVSTKDLDKDPIKPFLFLMDMSMCGVGVGFDTKGAGKAFIDPCPQSGFTYQIPDSREGWVESVRLLLSFYLWADPYVDFDYSLIRPAGAELKTFGGIAPGPAPLQKLHKQLREILDANTGKPITSRIITDVMNMIGCCVVSGNIRRSAEIAFGEYDDKEFQTLKDYSKFPERQEFGWASNNSVFVSPGVDYSSIAKAASLNGEPGLIWLDNCRNYGRFIDGPDYKDKLVMGLNPCAEIPLESFELCNLVEVYPTKHDSMEDYLRTLKYAYLYSKTVSLVPIHWEESNAVKLRNLRLGISLSGVVQAIEKLGQSQFQKWCDQGYKTIKYYDSIYSGWLTVRESIRLTTVKPSGSVSLLAGTTAGIHWPQDLYYIRRMRLPKDSPLVTQLKRNGYNVIPAPEQPETTVVAEFPVAIEAKRTQRDVSIWEKVELAAFMQKFWADNAVSVTVDFQPEIEGPEIETILKVYENDLKSISFLPRLPEGAFEAMPYESISKDTYTTLNLNIVNRTFSQSGQDGTDEKFCDSEACGI